MSPPRKPPTNLTPDVHEALVTSLRLGMPVNHACRYAGVATTTYYGWLRRGEAELASTPSIYAQLLRGTRRAEAEGLLQNLALIRGAAQGSPGKPPEQVLCKACQGKGSVLNEGTNRWRKCSGCGGSGWLTHKPVKGVPPDWRAAAWLVERRFPHDFGRHVLETVDGSAMDELHASPDQLRARREAVVSRLMALSPPETDEPGQDGGA